MKKHIIIIINIILLIIAVVVGLIVWRGFNQSKEADSSDGINGEMTTDNDTYFEGPYTTVMNDVVQKQRTDSFVIPDKYNSGVQNLKALTKAKEGKIGKVTFSESSGYLVINCYQNMMLSGSVQISDVDFSERGVRVYNDEKMVRDVVIEFTNCKFSSFRSFEHADSNISFVFKNCSFEHCAGSNITLESCMFSGGVVDCINPYNNFKAKNTYFLDKSIKDIVDTSGVHTDGVQIFGTRDGECGNIRFDNCRFEMPILLNSANAVNAPIMLQVEFCDADNVHFENCIVNGGGYSIYARAIGGNKISNSSIKDISVGCSARWGAVYPDVTESITVKNIISTDSLYVSTVTSQKDGVYVCVTNDTNKERTLMVCTDKGKKFFSIDKCPTYEQLSDEMTFSDYPFDILLNVGEDLKWLVCFDVTDDMMKQIRYENWSDVVLFVNPNGDIVEKK